MIQLSLYCVFFPLVIHFCCIFVKYQSMMDQEKNKTNWTFSTDRLRALLLLAPGEEPTTRTMYFYHVVDSILTDKALGLGTTVFQALCLAQCRGWAPCVMTQGPLKRANNKAARVQYQLIGKDNNEDDGSGHHCHQDTAQSGTSPQCWGPVSFTLTSSF